MTVNRGTRLNAVDIQDRRRLVFRYHALGLTPQEMHPLINAKYSSSIETVRRDLRQLDAWLPSLLSLEAGAVEGSLYRLIGHIHLARRRLLQIMYESNNDAVVTGAAKGVGILADREAQLLMDTGMFTRAALKVDAGPTQFILQSWRPDPKWTEEEEKELDELEIKAREAAKQNFMDSERRRPDNPSHPADVAIKEDIEQAQQKKPSPHGDLEPASRGVSLPDSMDTSLGGTRVGGYVVRKK